MFRASSQIPATIDCQSDIGEAQKFIHAAIALAPPLKRIAISQIRFTRFKFLQLRMSFVLTFGRYDLAQPAYRKLFDRIQRPLMNRTYTDAFCRK